MSVRSFCRLLLTCLFSLAFVFTSYLYLYPAFHGCDLTHSHVPNLNFFQRTLASLQRLTQPATDDSVQPIPPFRLLVLADPQLEGDSSLPDPDDALLPRLRRHWDRATEPGHSLTIRWNVLEVALGEILLADIPSALQALRKRLDLFGNDYYLAHIYRTLHWWTNPTHVTVLGDLIGSQWVTDEEFEHRGWRYWSRVFADGHRAEDEITMIQESPIASTFNLTDKSWAHRIINIAGNHDIGYAGDISEARIARFEKAFGRANWDVRFEYPPQAEHPPSVSRSPTLHLVVLNSLILDGPTLSPDTQSATFDFINSLITSRSSPVEDRSSFTILLTHLPLHKAAGVCVDAPFFDYHDYTEADGKFNSGGLKEQNHLSEHISHQGILQGIFGMSGDIEAPMQGKGRNGLVLTGHDHEGCDVWHYLHRSPTESEESQAESRDGKSHNAHSWQAVPWREAGTQFSNTGIREVTLRSMMGEFGGNAGLLSAWFDFEEGEWKYDIQMCRLGVQHIWWGIHVLDLVTAAVGLAYAILHVFARTEGSTKVDIKRHASKGSNSISKEAGSLTLH